MPEKISSNSSISKRQLTILNKRLQREVRKLKYRLKVGEERIKEIQEKRNKTISEKPINQLPHYILEPSKPQKSKIEQQTANSKKFYISGTIKCKIRWVAKGEDGRSTWTKWYDEEKKESHIILAVNTNELKYRFTSLMKEIYNIDGEYRQSKLVRLTSDSIRTANKKDKLPITEMPMRSIQPLQYDFIKEHKGYLNGDGFCVIDNIVGMYGNKIKALNTRDKVIKIIADYQTDLWGIWKPEDGITAKQINECICKVYDISHYAFDITNQVFLSHISKNRNYPALSYYAVNNHQYLVRDPETVQTLVKKANYQNQNFHTSIFEEDKPKENRFATLPIEENINVKDYVKYPSSIFIYSKNKTNLSNVLKEVIEIYNIIPSYIKSNKTSITPFQLTINEITYYIVLDPNHQTQIQEDKLRTLCERYNIEFKGHLCWRLVKALCDKYNIEFKNQTFVSFIISYKQMILDKVKERKTRTEKERLVILQRYNNICMNCKKSLDLASCEIDHIQPLCNANDDDENLMPLCKSCHKEKTKLEQEDGSYIKINPTESSFNTTTEEIIKSAFYKSYAFIEPVETRNPKNKLYHFDLNRCRKNILRYSKYNYPVFTVMDKVKRYKGEKETGLYFVHSTFSYFPLRGNGWYTLPTIEYCLDNDIIEEQDIIYVSNASIELPYNYFNNVIDTIHNTLDLEIQKIAINSIIGQFNKNINKNETYKTLCIQKNLGNAMELFFERDGCFIEEFDVAGNTYYQVYKQQTDQSGETEGLIYKQIVEIEAIELHKLSQIVERKGGKVIFLNTDCISVEFKGDLPFETDEKHNILNYYYDDEQTVLKYKLEFKEETNKEQVARMKRYRRDGTYFTNKLTETRTTDEMVEFDDLVEQTFNSNKSCLIEGRAGTGKSTFINKLVEKLEKANKSVIKLSPTNKAALVIKGQTINKFFAGIKKLMQLNG